MRGLACNAFRQVRTVSRRSPQRGQPVLLAKRFHIALKQTDCLIIVGVNLVPRPGKSFPRCQPFLG
jgi:hypothetical protein